MNKKHRWYIEWDGAYGLCGMYAVKYGGFCDSHYKKDERYLAKVRCEQLNAQEDE